jgi:hypothetical protein
MRRKTESCLRSFTGERSLFFVRRVDRFCRAGRRATLIPPNLLLFERANVSEELFDVVVGQIFRRFHFDFTIGIFDPFLD